MSFYGCVGVLILILSILLALMAPPRDSTEKHIFVFQLVVACLFILAGIYLGEK